MAPVVALRRPFVGMILDGVGRPLAAGLKSSTSVGWMTPNFWDAPQKATSMSAKLRAFPHHLIMHHGGSEFQQEVSSG